MLLFVEKLHETIARIHEKGVSILLVEENVPFTLTLTERLCFMIKGKIIHHGTRQPLSGTPEFF